MYNNQSISIAMTNNKSRQETSQKKATLSKKGKVNIEKKPKTKKLLFMFAFLVLIKLVYFGNEDVKQNMVAEPTKEEIASALQKPEIQRCVQEQKRSFEEQTKSIATKEQEKAHVLMCLHMVDGHKKEQGHGYSKESSGQQSPVLKEFKF